VQLPDGHGHLFGQAARQRHPDGAEVGARGPAPAQAGAAAPARDRRVDRDGPAHLERPGVPGRERGHGAADLVALAQREAGVVPLAEEHVQVGAAEADRADVDDGVVRSGIGVAHRLDGDLTGGGGDRGAHQRAPARASRAPSAVYSRAARSGGA
jgi:hypothetical protein